MSLHNDLHSNDPHTREMARLALQQEQERAMRESATQNDSGSSVLPMWMVRWFCVPAMPLIYLSFLPELIPQWLTTLPPFFSTFIGTFLFSGTVIIASLVGSIFYYRLFWRNRMSNELMWVMFIGGFILFMLIGV